MNRFWVGISCAVLAALVGLSSLPSRRGYADVSVPTTRAILYASMSILVGVVWAICFRREFEPLRLSIRSIMALIAMQAILFWAIRTFRPL